MAETSADETITQTVSIYGNDTHFIHQVGSYLSQIGGPYTAIVAMDVNRIGTRYTSAIIRFIEQHSREPLGERHELMNMVTWRCLNGDGNKEIWFMSTHTCNFLPPWTHLVVDATEITQRLIDLQIIPILLHGNVKLQWMVPFSGPRKTIFPDSHMVTQTLKRIKLWLTIMSETRRTSKLHGLPKELRRTLYGYLYKPL